MTFSLIMFGASGLAIMLLIGLKMLQEKLGLLLFWPDLREKVELFVARQRNKFAYFTRGFSRRSFYIALHYILSKIRAFAVYIQQVIDKRLVRLINLIKGRHMIDSTRGKASHFLHDIGRYKDKFRRQ